MTPQPGRLHDRVAVVAGGAAGIGAATVRMFVEEGANVVIGDLNADAGQALVDELADAGQAHRVRFQSVDVSHPLPGVSYAPTYTGMNYGTTGRPNDLVRLDRDRL